MFEDWINVMPPRGKYIAWGPQKLWCGHYHPSSKTAGRCVSGDRAVYEWAGPRPGRRWVWVLSDHQPDKLPVAVRAAHLFCDDEFTGAGGR